MSRNEIILAGIDRGMRIIEIGPSFSPIAPKADGWNTCVVDYASTEELVEKFRGHPGTDISRIETVDVVWNGAALDQAVPPEQLGTFDACIVSHVLEHMPDPIGFFQSLERVLTRRGLVSLAVPDKRVCFDFFKPISSTGELLEAHDRGATTHARKAIFDDLALYVYADGAFAWDRRPIRELTFLGPLSRAKEAYDNYRPQDNGEYVDCHAWHFTPSSFALVIVELAALGQIDFSVERQLPTEGCEFFVNLIRGREEFDSDDDLQSRRMQLLRAALAEVRDQVDALVREKPSNGSGKDDEITALKAELAAFRRRRVVRATDRAAALVRDSLLRRGTKPRPVS
jgi:SAM-dependent methyltransferase